MTTLAAKLAITAIPATIRFIGNWGSKAIKTWGPSTVANQTIKGTAEAGRRIFGGKGFFGKIGYGLGKAAGWVIAPLVAQSKPVQGNLNTAATVASVVTDVAGGLLGSYLENKWGDKKKTETQKKPATEQMKEAYQKAKKQQQPVDMARLVRLMEMGKKTGTDVEKMINIMQDADGTVDLDKVEQMMLLKAAPAVELPKANPVAVTA